MQSYVEVELTRFDVMDGDTFVLCSDGMSGAGLEVAHEVIEEFLMLGLAEAGQVGVEGGDGRTAVAEVVLDLPKVLAAFEQVRGVGMALMPSSA